MSQIILLSIFIALATADLHKLDFFKGGPFHLKPANNFYEIDVGLGNIPNGNNVMALADFNNDLKTDILSVGDDKKSITIYLWTGDQDWQDIFIKQIEIKMDNEVQGVIAGDFNNDGKPDFVVSQSVTGSKQLLVELYLQTDNVRFEKTASFNADSQPTALDLRGDKSLQLLYQSGTSRLAAHYVINEKKFQALQFTDFVVSGVEQCLDTTKALANTIKTQNNNAFVDFNGDCKADIFIESVDTNGQTNYEFWIKLQSGKFCLIQNDMVDSSFKSSLFLDITNSGVMDMIILEENIKLNTLNLHVYKNQLKQQSAQTPSLCNSGVYDKSPYLKMNQQADSTYYQKQLLIEEANLFQPSAYQPGIMRGGDINGDGYVDLLITVKNEASTGNSKGSTLVFLNNNGQFSKSDITEMNVFNNNNTLYTFFFDIGELGKLSLLQVYQDNSGATQVKAFLNFMNFDTFFLKAIGYQKLFDIQQMNNGAYYYGTTYQCQVTKLDGNNRIAYFGQLQRSGYSALDTPFVFIGLGRTNNYVQNLYVSMSLDTEFKQTWTPIIPNSQLLMYPQSKVENWILDVYVKPTENTWIVIISTASILLILGIIILYYHYKEKEEDKAQQEQYFFVFN